VPSSRPTFASVILIDRTSLTPILSITRYSWTSVSPGFLARFSPAAASVMGSLSHRPPVAHKLRRFVELTEKPPHARIEIGERCTDIANERSKRAEPAAGEGSVKLAVGN
jgi:hypothetical protein